MSKAGPRIDIVGGPNGCGKTTLAQSLFVGLGTNPNFINPDSIALGLSQADFEKASFQAGRILLNEVRRRIDRKESFSFESTLSGRSYLPILKKAQEIGFAIAIIFVFVRTREKSIERIAKRVREGGHDIPKKSIVRRFPRTFENFWQEYRHLCDEWTIVDNSNGTPVTILTKESFERLQEKDKVQFERLFLKMRPHAFKKR